MGAHIILTEPKLPRHTEKIEECKTLGSELAKAGKALKCPSCSATIQMPTTVTTITCNHCGAAINAADIFEKIKTLIG